MCVIRQSYPNHFTKEMPITRTCSRVPAGIQSESTCSCKYRDRMFYLTTYQAEGAILAENKWLCDG